MIKILTKIREKITMIVIENREPHYFIIIFKYEGVLLFLFSYQMLASIFDSRKRSSYYKVYVFSTFNTFLLFLNRAER